MKGQKESDADVGKGVGMGNNGTWYVGVRKEKQVVQVQRTEAAGRMKGRGGVGGNKNSQEEEGEKMETERRKLRQSSYQMQRRKTNRIKHKAGRVIYGIKQEESSAAGATKASLFPNETLANCGLLGYKHMASQIFSKGVKKTPSLYPVQPPYGNVKSEMAMTVGQYVTVYLNFH